MKNRVVLILLFSYFNSNSQIVFEKYFGTFGANNVGFYLQEVANGYLISGSTDNDGIIIRTNEFGDSIWQKNYTNGSVESIRSANNGSFVLAGTDYNSPYNGVFRLIDSVGNIIWDTITTSNPFTMYGIAAMQLPDGNFALLENDNYPFQEFLRIRKISASNQDTLWTADISKVAGCSSSSLLVTFDSAIVVANGTFGNPYPHAILSKTFSNGNLAWKRDYYYTGDTGIAANSIAQTNDSGFIVIGYKVYGNPQSDYRLLLMKTNANGLSIWTKEYNLNNSNAFPDVIQTSDGGFALIGTVVYPQVGGNFDYRIVLMKTDSNGDSLWTREFTGNNINDAKKIIQTNDGGYAIIGTSTDQTINQNYLYLIKTDSLGNIVQSPLPCNPTLTVNIPDSCNPDSNRIFIPSFGTLPNDYYWYNSTGILQQSDTGITSGDTILSLPSGTYYVVINDSGVCGIDTLNFVIPEPIIFHIDSITHTSCIGCMDGIIYFTITGGLLPYSINITGGVLSGDSITNLISGAYSICATDSFGCISCDQTVILEDPSMISRELNKNKYVLFPNPVSHIAKLHFNGEGIKSIRILDMNGQPVKMISNENHDPGFHELLIDCYGLAKGYYTIEIIDENKKTFLKLLAN